MSPQQSSQPAGEIPPTPYITVIRSTLTTDSLGMPISKLVLTKVSVSSGRTYSINAASDGTLATTSVSSVAGQSSPSSITSFSTTPGPSPPGNSKETQSPPPLNSNSGSDSAGVKAGIAIGCLLGGLIIGALAVFFFMKRRNEKRNHYRGNVPPVAAEKTMSLATANTFGADSAAAVVENTLPQPAEDQSILNEMVKLQNSIKNHVSSFYEKDHVPPIDGNLEAYDYLGGNLPLPASSLSALLQNPGTRVAAIRFCIAWAALHRAGFYCSSADSFLPPGVAAVLSNMSGIENNPRAQEAFTSKWRTITATLMSKTFSRSHITYTDPRMAPITHTLQILDDIIGSYAVGRDPNDSRRKNLEEIFKRAAAFAFLLFSQPTSWQFAWDDSSNQSSSLVIFPALWQTADEEGRAIRPPRVYGQVEVAPAVEWK